MPKQSQWRSIPNTPRFGQQDTAGGSSLVRAEELDSSASNGCPVTTTTTAAVVSVLGAHKSFAGEASIQTHFDKHGHKDGTTKPKQAPLGISYMTPGGKHVSVLENTAGRSHILKSSGPPALAARAERQSDGPRRLVLRRFDIFGPLTGKAFEGTRPPQRNVPRDPAIGKILNGRINLLLLTRFKICFSNWPHRPPCRWSAS